MNKIIILNVFGEYHTKIIHDNIESIISISKEINHALMTEKDASMVLSLKSCAPRRIENIISTFKHIISKLDNNYTNSTYTEEVTNVKNYIIDIFSNLDNMNIAIINHNNAKLNLYNNIVMELISNYN